MSERMREIWLKSAYAMACKPLHQLEEYGANEEASRLLNEIRAQLRQVIYLLMHDEECPVDLPENWESRS
jgi:hypothetical protein